MVRSFAPVLAGNGGGGVLNVLSALSWFSVDGVESGAYEVVADEWSARVKASLARDPSAFYGVLPA
jgi:hypothetical protein